MKKYIGTKMVSAEPMSKGEAFKKNLLKSGVEESQILKINFEELENAHLREKLALYKFITDSEDRVVLESFYVLTPILYNS